MAELAWRKFPVSTIRNEYLDFISDCLPDELATAPYMFYMTMICTCDDEGVFDIEDGVIWSRMMKVKNPEAVLKVATLMAQRRIIMQILPGSSKFMITDWEAPDRKGYAAKTKTAEERRQIIAQKIEAEQRQRTLQAAPEFPEPYPFPPAEQPAPTFQAASQAPVVDFDTMRSMRARNDAFFCSLNDKNAQNVVNTEREREERDTLDRVEEIHTHTQETRQTEDTIETEREETEATQPAGCLEHPSGSVAEEKQEERPEENSQNTIPVSNSVSVEEHAPNESAEQVKRNKEEAAFQGAYPELKEVADGFFVRNSMLFNKEMDSGKVEEICRRVFALRTDKNSAKIILQTLLKQFQLAATTKGNFFNGCAITPQFLLLQNTWEKMLQRVSALLLTHGESKDKWHGQMVSAPSEVERAKNAEEVENDIRRQCKELGIDPDDPNRIEKLCIKTAEAKTPALG
ncbi:hypothetical protein [Treponema sp.]|uniref:hypothetical protein n=1 Tax=Treponema sp. TaxID=166 RepID=UPI00298DFBB6|nr:hypothetical protein [Treponema sp.]MCQ2242112.1 hypothetical protein [Treponema sp.]